MIAERFKTYMVMLYSSRIFLRTSSTGIANRGLTLSLSKVEDLSVEVGPRRTISIHFIVCICMSSHAPHKSELLCNVLRVARMQHKNTTATLTKANLESPTRLQGFVTKH